VRNIISFEGGVVATNITQEKPGNMFAFLSSRYQCWNSISPCPCRGIHVI